MSEARIYYAGMEVRVDCADSRMARAITRHYPAFLEPRDSFFTLHVEVNVCGTERQELIENPAMTQKGSLFTFDAPGYTGQFDLAKGLAKMTFSSRNPFADLDLFLRIAGSLWAIERGGVQLHCATIAHQNKAFIFYGHSGSGKTTSARLSSDKLILNDDLNILLPENGSWAAHATPFWNPTQARPNNLSAPLAGLFRLIQAPQHRCKDMDPVRALAELISCVPVLKVAPQYLPNLTQNLQALVNSCPCHWLEFRKDAGFWEVIT